jgi:enterochelin esterase family protein
MDDHDGYPGASPRIARLRSALMADGTGATERFWRDVAERGAPLVEPLADGRTALVTFVWRGAGELRNVAVLGSLMGLDAEQNQLAHLAGSDVWYRTYQLPMAARGRYWFSPDDPLAPLSVEHWDERIANWRRGPRNPATFRDPWYLGEADVREVLVSVLSLPDAPAQPWGKEVPGVPAGMLAEHMVRSVLLGNARRVWVYTPAGYAAGELGAVVFLDGHAYAYAMSAPTVLDNLIAAGRIPPLVAVFVDSLGHRREVELPCYPPFADFLADELLPWAREHYRITASPERTVVGGSSFGGLAAAFAGLRRPSPGCGGRMPLATCWRSQGRSGGRRRRTRNTSGWRAASPRSPSCRYASTSMSGCLRPSPRRRRRRNSSPTGICERCCGQRATRCATRSSAAGTTRSAGGARSRTASSRW